MTKPAADLRLGLGLAGFCLFLLIYLIPVQVGGLTEAASLMPVLVTIFVLALSLVLIVQALRSGQAGAGPSARGGESGHGEQAPPWRAMAGVAAVLAGYAFLLEYTGFLLTSAVAMVLLFLIFGIRDWLKIALITAGTLLVIYFSFEKLLGAPLPVGEFIETWLE